MAVCSVEQTDDETEMRTVAEKVGLKAVQWVAKSVYDLDEMKDESQAEKLVAWTVYSKVGV